jgi:hypothetical protein
MSLTTTLLVLFALVGLPVVTFALIALRIRAKRGAADEFFGKVQASIESAGFEPLGEGRYRPKDRPDPVAPGGLTMSVSTNPLLKKEFTLRLAAYSGTIHEFELRSGKPVPAEFAAFAPLLGRWDSCGKMFTECYAAKVTRDPDVADDARRLSELAALPLSKAYRGGTLTYREGFEKDVPQWHWRHDFRARLPRDVRRVCVSYYRDGPLLNPVLLRLFWELAADGRKLFVSDTEDLQFLELAFGRRELACWGAIVEFFKPEPPLAADLHTDGEFFGGLLVAPDLPPGFEVEGMPRVYFHDAALKAFRKLRLYVRRLWDDEFSWYSGEYEILSAYPLDVRGPLQRIAGEIGAQVMEIDRRFHRRLVVPLEH